QRTLRATVVLADVLRRDPNRIFEALPMIENAIMRLKLQFKDDDPELFWAMHGLADIYKDPKINRLPDALSIYQRLLKLRTETLGPDHPDTLLTMNNLANMYTRTGHPDDAIPIMQETVRLRQIKHGPDHPETLDSMQGLVAAYRNAGRLQEATSL